MCIVFLNRWGCKGNDQSFRLLQIWETPNLYCSKCVKMSTWNNGGVLALWILHLTPISADVNGVKYLSLVWGSAYCTGWKNPYLGLTELNRNSWGLTYLGHLCPWVKHRNCDQNHRTVSWWKRIILTSDSTLFLPLLTTFRTTWWILWKVRNLNMGLLL